MTLILENKYGKTKEYRDLRTREDARDCIRREWADPENLTARLFEEQVFLRQIYACQASEL